MHLYKTTKGAVLRTGNESFLLANNWDELINQNGLYNYLLQSLKVAVIISEAVADSYIENYPLPPIDTQEVWAAGVTYLRSRDARMDESKDAGAADCYQRVYEAERPELFFKATAHRVVGNGGELYIRKDSAWNVPEPELTLYINSAGNIEAYTIGNDMSSRSIEGDNPLYLPQAKIYNKSAGLGPCLYVTDTPISPATEITLFIYRNDVVKYTGHAPISRMKRSLTELAGYLYRECDFPSGAFLMTGTCLVPPDHFTLQKGDIVVIGIDGIGELRNTISCK